MQTEPAAPAARRSAAAGDGGTFRHNFILVRDRLFQLMDVAAAVAAGREAVEKEVLQAVAEIASRERLRMTAAEQERTCTLILNDMFGLGPIEPLLDDPTISDILINGPHQIYVERRGKLERTDVAFRDNDHLVNVAQRIAASVGRRVDEMSPLCDARLADGSRVNIVLPPLAIDGASISIRKFAKHKVGFQRMVEGGSVSPAMARVLEIASRCRLNIVISGGTGSGKTTLLNALSQMIDAGERIVTIEDAAELQLQQPHVVRLETRPPSIEGGGEITQRDLVKNALRMRPDRIILGETRGAEAFDVLQAMNTGHDGSMTTLHANSPRDALARLENMVLSGNPNLPQRAIRGQIVSAVNLVIQVSRLRDGSRRVLNLTEVVGMEGDVIITQDLFKFEYDPGDFAEEVRGRFVSGQLRPVFYERASYFGLGHELMALLTGSGA
ncbi:MAG: CpaF family protein [Alphaproteobacteria bacterium]